MRFKNNNLSYNGDDEKELFIPSNPKSLKQTDVFRYLQNLELEIARRLFSQSELLLLLQDALYGKFLDKKRRPFFLYHFLPLWENTINKLFEDNAHPKIIELGCGTGTSSLLFALLGAEVIGIDLNRTLIEICQKRKQFYEKHIGRDINACFHNANAFNFPFENHAAVDAFFSLFAFNLMKPPDILLARLVPSLRNGGKMIISDGNQSSLYSCLIPTRRRSGELSPLMMQKKMEMLGCRICKIETHCAIPPFVFRFPRAQKLALKIEDLVRLSGLHKFFGISYTIVAEKIK